MPNSNSLLTLKNELSGDLHLDNTHRIIYSTDASAYREMPLAVAFPKDKEDIIKLVKFADKEKTSLIPRGGGTSLAGQVTGKGIVVDTSKYMNKILRFDTFSKTAVVEPGVVLSELNKIIQRNKLQFGPETSSANRCTIGGMLGNNACGLHSLVHGSVREHTISLKAVLANGQEVEFKELTKQEFSQKCKGDSLENKIYFNLNKLLSDKEIAEEIENEYPDKAVPRRNSGYALDFLANTNVFSGTETGENINLCKLIAGSEGTLAFVTEITLNLVPLLPHEKALSVVHFSSLQDAFKANLIALKYQPTAVELSDKTILDLTKNIISLKKNRFFIEGEPAAILIIEFAENDKKIIVEKSEKMKAEMLKAGLGYAFPLVWGKDINTVWDLRKAGLGVLSNMQGDAKPVSVTEDTAVNVNILPEYMEEFDNLLKTYNLSCVYHAHIATGELHLRPILNLKDEKDVLIFREIAYKTALLVKKYKGSLSGEHGDGRLRGEFLELLYGEKIYSVFQEIKSVWDKNNIFNPEKIVNTPQMNSSLRYEPGKAVRKYETIFDFSADGGIVQTAERCNGSADCRKSSFIGGTMCPSFMASKDEKQTTRARANMLREILTNSDNPFNNNELYDILSLCLSCKACKSECPSGVDMTKLKAEFIQHYFDKNGVPLRSKIVANITKINSILSKFALLNNLVTQTGFFSKLIQNKIGFSTKRKLPKLYRKKLTSFNINKLNNSFRKTGKSINSKTVYLFPDEFTNYNEPHIGIKAVKLLNYLGFTVKFPDISESGRTYLSKGLVRKAKEIAQNNVFKLQNIINEDCPLIGIEPSAILTFRDEYTDFSSDNSENDINFKQLAEKLAKNCFTIEEFLANSIKQRIIEKTGFTKKTKKIILHGHCMQKAIASTAETKIVLSFPENYSVEEIPSGCCGMAGSFGYEKENYELSMKIGELILFPAVRNAEKDTIIAAPGTSCRHQIKDGTGRTALHPVEILFEAIL